MPNTMDLPRGIRNNNPGNLRNGILADTPHKVIGGFAVFRTPADGLANLAKLALNYYTHYKMRTPFDFITRYAPPNENDSIAYVRFVASYMRCPLGAEKKFDMRLTSMWNMIDLMRGIIRLENGNPPPELHQGGEWFSAPELWSAIERVYAP